MYGIGNQYRFNPMNQMIGGGAAIAVTLQMMQMMEMMQMTRQFAGGNGGPQFGDPFAMGGPGAQSMMYQPQPMPWNMNQAQNYGGVNPAYQSYGNDRPCPPPFGRIDSNMSPADQLDEIRGWSRGHDAQNGISPYTSLRQDSATNAKFSSLIEQSGDELLQSCKSHPGDKPVQTEIWNEVQAKKRSCEERGVPFTSGDQMRMNSTLLAQAADEGRVSADTGVSARDYLKVDRAAGQAMTDTFLKGGQQVPFELQRYVGHSQFGPAGEFGHGPQGTYN